MRFLLLLFAGCWSVPQPTGPAALLRRHHAPGDVLRICQRGDGTIRASPEDKEASKEAATMVMRSIQDERLLAVQPRRLELRRDTLTLAFKLQAPGGEPVAMDTGRLDGTAFAIDDRNRQLDLGFVESPVDDGDANEVTLRSSPNIGDFIHMTYPERAIRKYETFPLRISETVRNKDKVPTQVEVDVTFTVRKVTPTHVELTCKGTQVETARRHAQVAIAEMEIACRVRIDRRDGRTARWWIDSTGKATLPDKPPVLYATHFDVVIGQAPDAAAVCARASE